MKKGKFIVFEGIEGSGKSTMLELLKEQHRDMTVYTREPGGTPYAELIRTAALKSPLAVSTPPETTLCLMFGSRFDNMINMIEPALEEGKDVATDRFDSSSFAYQVHAQTDGELAELFWVLRRHLRRTPDLYVLFDVAVSEAMRRTKLRNEAEARKNGKVYDHFDNRDFNFHTKVRDGYLKFFESVPHLIIDANPPIEVVRETFISKMKEILSN